MAITYLMAVACEALCEVVEIVGARVAESPPSRPGVKVPKPRIDDLLDAVTSHNLKSRRMTLLIG